MANIATTNWKPLPKLYVNTVMDTLVKKSYLPKWGTFKGFMPEGTGMSGVLPQKLTRPEADWVAYQGVKPDKTHTIGELEWFFDELAYTETYFIRDVKRFGYNIESLIRQDMPYAFSKALDKSVLGTKTGVPTQIASILRDAATAGASLSLAGDFPANTTLAQAIQGAGGAVATLLGYGYTADRAIVTKAGALGIMTSVDANGNPSGQIIGSSGLGEDDFTLRLFATGLPVGGISSEILPTTTVMPTTAATTANGTAGLAVLGIVGRFKNIFYMLERGIASAKFTSGEVDGVNLITQNAEAYRFATYAALAISLAKDEKDGAASATEYPFIVITA